MVNIYAIDHGNESIKTLTSTFPAGIISSETRPNCMVKEWIRYKGKYYYLSKSQQKYRMDKSQDEMYLVLTFFAMCRDEAKKAVDLSEPLFLAVGLPTMFMGTLKERFEKYLLQENDYYFEYSLDEQSSDKHVKIAGCRAYPQGFAAAIAYRPKREADGQIKKPCQLLAEHTTWLMVDIGGYTCDVIYFEDSQPQLDKCSTKEIGVLRMFERIAIDVSTETGFKLNKHDIEAVFKGEKVILTDEVIKLVQTKGREWADKIIANAAEKVDDLRTVPVLFMGGGSMLLKDLLLENKNLPPVVDFINDQRANVKGYYLIAKGQMK